MTNSTLSNIDTTRELKSKLKQEFSDVDYYIIANFQDRRGTALKVEKIEESLEEKTFGFSAVQKNSNQKIISIIKDILRISILEREEKNHLISKFDEVWLEIDKARVSETRGDRLAAAKIFSNTASQLKKFSSDILFKHKKEEINVTYYLCKAWENLAYAEELKEAEKFLEAANHFTQASELIHDSKLKLLVLGNSEFCKALKLGLEFEKSKEFKINSDKYLKVKAMLDKVADLYRKGGFEKEANWALTTSDYFTESMNQLKNT